MSTEPTPTRSREQVIGAGIDWLARWTLRWLLVALGAVALGWLVGQLWSILLPILLGLILATVLQPPARWLERLGLPPLVAALSTLVLGLVVIGGVVTAVAPSVTSQAVELADSASQGLAELEQLILDSGLGITEEQVSSVIAAAQSRLQSSAASIASGVLVGVGAVTSALLTAVLTLVLAFFVLKDGRGFLPWVRRVTGPTAGRHLVEVGSRAWSTLGGFVRTQALVGLIDGVLIGTGLAIIGVPLAFPLAVLTFVAAFAPIVGAVAVGVLAVLVALVADGWVAALIVLALVLVVQQLEGNVFLPWLQGRSLALHPAVILLTVVLGSTLFGVAGAFLGVPVVAVAAVVLRYLLEQVADGTDDEPPLRPGPDDGRTDNEPGDEPGDEPGGEEPGVGPADDERDALRRQRSSER